MQKVSYFDIRQAQWKANEGVKPNVDFLDKLRQPLEQEQKQERQSRHNQERSLA